jgi:hypothetical protein
MRDGDEHISAIRMYHIDEEKYDFLCCVQSYRRNDGTYGPHNPAPDDVVEAGSVEDVILNDLGFTTDTYAEPGALYYMYDATFWCGVALVTETRAYNV